MAGYLCPECKCEEIGKHFQGCSRKLTVAFPPQATRAMERLVCGECGTPACYVPEEKCYRHKSYDNPMADAYAGQILCERYGYPLRSTKIGPSWDELWERADKFERRANSAVSLLRRLVGTDSFQARYDAADFLRELDKK